MRAVLQSVDLLEAFVAELALLDAEVVDLEKQMAEFSRAGHMEGGKPESAIVSRLATCSSPWPRCMRKLPASARSLMPLRAAIRPPPSARGGAKRSADEVQTTEGGGAEPESKRAKGDS
jgi:hypothetical protein